VAKRFLRWLDRTYAAKGSRRREVVLYFEQLLKAVAQDRGNVAGEIRECDKVGGTL
jgi:hypothetical protein